MSHLTLQYMLYIGLVSDVCQSNVQRCHKFYDAACLLDTVDSMLVRMLTNH